jgi:hypothetical protein
MSIWEQLGGLFARGSFRVTLANRNTLVYREKGKRLTIPGEMLANGFEIYVVSMTNWDDGSVMTLLEREIVIDNLRAFLTAQGETLVLN